MYVLQDQRLYFFTIVFRTLIRPSKLSLLKLRLSPQKSLPLDQFSEINLWGHYLIALLPPLKLDMDLLHLALTDEVSHPDQTDLKTLVPHAPEVR